MRIRHDSLKAKTPQAETDRLWVGRPGPILTDRLRRKVAARIAQMLRTMAGVTADLTDPDTWRRVAGELDIITTPVPVIACGEGLVRDDYHERWVILYHSWAKRIHQARAIIHELAHWFQKEIDPLILCNLPVVYWYEDLVELERHRIAHMVERRILQANLSAKRGYFL